MAPRNSDIFVIPGHGIIHQPLRFWFYSSSQLFGQVYQAVRRRRERFRAFVWNTVLPDVFRGNDAKGC